MLQLSIPGCALLPSILTTVTLLLMLVTQPANAVINRQFITPAPGADSWFTGLGTRLATNGADPLTDPEYIPTLSMMAFTRNTGNPPGLWAGRIGRANGVVNGLYSSGVSWEFQNTPGPNGTQNTGNINVPPPGIAWVAGSYVGSNAVRLLGSMYSAFGGNLWLYNDAKNLQGSNHTIPTNPTPTINLQANAVDAQIAAAGVFATLTLRQEVPGAPPNSSNLCIGPLYNPSVGQPLIQGCTYSDWFTAKNPVTGVPLNQSASLSMSGQAVNAVYGYSYGIIRSVRGNGTHIQDIALPAGDVPFSVRLDAFGGAAVYGDPNANNGTGRVVAYNLNWATQDYQLPGTELKYPYKAIKGRMFGRSATVNYFATHVAAGAPGAFGNAGAIVYWKNFTGGVWMPSQVPLTTFGGLATFVSTRLGWDVAIQPTATRIMAGAPGSGLGPFLGGFVMYVYIDQQMFPVALPTLPSWQQVWVPLTFRSVDRTAAYVDGIVTNINHDAVLIGGRATELNVTIVAYYPLSTLFVRDTDPTTPGYAYNVVDATPDVLGASISPAVDPVYSNSGTLLCLSDDKLRKLAMVRSSLALGVPRLIYSARASLGDDWTVAVVENGTAVSGTCLVAYYNDLVCSPSLRTFAYINVAANPACNSQVIVNEWPGQGLVNSSLVTTKFNISIGQQTGGPTLATGSGAGAQLALSGNQKVLVVLSLPYGMLQTFNLATGRLIQSRNVSSLAYSYVNAIVTDWAGQRIILTYSNYTGGAIPPGQTYQATVFQADAANDGRFTLTPTALPVGDQNRTVPAYIGGGLAACKSGAKVFVGSSISNGLLPCAIPYTSPIMSIVGSPWQVDTNNTLCAFGTASNTTTGVMIVNSDRQLLSLDGTQAWFRSWSDRAAVNEYRALNTYANECMDISQLTMAVPLFDQYSLEPPSFAEVGFHFQLFAFTWAISYDGRFLVVGAINEVTLELVAFVYTRTSAVTYDTYRLTAPEYTLFDVLIRGPRAVEAESDLYAPSVVTSPPNANVRISGDGLHVVMSTGWLDEGGFSQPLFNYWLDVNGTNLYKGPQEIPLPDVGASIYAFGTALDLGRDSEILVASAVGTFPNRGHVLVYLLGNDTTSVTNATIRNVNYTLFQVIDVPLAGAGLKWGQKLSISAYGGVLVVGQSTATLDIYNWTNTAQGYAYQQRVTLPTDPSQTLLQSIKVAGLGLDIIAQASNPAFTLGQTYRLSRSNSSTSWTTVGAGLKTLAYPTGAGQSAQVGAVSVADQVGFVMSSFLQAFNTSSQCYQAGTFSLIDDTTDLWTFSQMAVKYFAGSCDQGQFSQGRLGGNTYSVVADGTMAAVGITTRVNSSLVSGRVLFYNTGISALTAIASAPTTPYPPPPTPPTPSPPVPTPPLAPTPPAPAPAPTPVAPIPQGPIAPSAETPFSKQLKELSSLSTAGTVIFSVAAGLFVVGVVACGIQAYRWPTRNSGNLKKKGT